MNDKPAAIGFKADTPQGQRWIQQQFAEKGYAEVQITQDSKTSRTARLYPINPPSPQGPKDDNH